MAESYTELKTRQQKEIGEFPCFWAFSGKQFAEGMAKLGLDPEKDKENVLQAIGGMFIRKSDEQKLSDMLARHGKELEDAIASDKAGDEGGFMFRMFEYELENHEYSYTGDSEEALDACGVTYGMLESNPAMRRALALAERAVMKNAV